MHLYKIHYTQLGFERAGLFKAIREQYRCREVLYPGCSVHITPSLYFPHVVYVDQSDAAAQFFAEETSILDFVRRNKHYKQSAYTRFIPQDYFQPLPLLEGSFDLLLSLFAGGIAASCAQYLKPGGLLLTNNHQDAANSSLTLTAMIKFHNGSYCISNDLKGTKASREKLNHKSLKQVNDRVQYIDNEQYYVFKRSL